MVDAAGLAVCDFLTPGQRRLLWHPRSPTEQFPQLVLREVGELGFESDTDGAYEESDRILEDDLGPSFPRAGRDSRVETHSCAVASALRPDEVPAV